MVPHENPLHMVCYRSICDFFKKLRVQHQRDQLRIRWIPLLLALAIVLCTGVVTQESIRRNLNHIRLSHRILLLTWSPRNITDEALRHEPLLAHSGRPDYLVAIWDAYSGNYAVALGELEMRLREASIIRAQCILVILARQAWRAFQEGDADSVGWLNDSLDLLVMRFGRNWLPPDSGYGDAWSKKSILHLASEGREVESRIVLRMAEILYSEAYLNDGGNVFSQLGYLYYGRHDLQTALEYYWKAVQSVNRGDDYRMLATIYEKIGDDSSIERVGRVAVENGQDEWGYYILGGYYSRIGSLDEAERYLKEVLAQEDIDLHGLLPWYTRLSYASVKQSQGDLAAAELHYELAAAFRPGTALESWALGYEAQMFAGAQRWGDAVQAYARAVMLPSPNTDWTVALHGGLAIAYSELGECDQAREHFQIAKGYGADDRSLLTYLSRCAPGDGTQ